MATVIDLGRLVKAKYPGTYDDLSDYEVGVRVKSKYPTEYGDFTDAPSPTSPTSQDQKDTYEQNRGLAQKAAGFLGIEKFGRGVATASRVASGSINQSGDEAVQSAQDTQKIIDAMRKLPVGSPERNRLAEFLKRGMIDPGYTRQENIDPGTTLTDREVLGSAANVALNAATPGAFKGGMGAKVAKNAALGAGYGAAGGLNEDKEGEDLVASTLIGSILGGSMPVAGKAASKAKQLFTEKLPENLMNRAVKPTLDELRKNIKFGSATLGKELLRENVKGSPIQLLKIADTKLAQFENELQVVLKTTKGTIKRDDLSKYLEPLVDLISTTPGLENDFNAIAQILNEFPKEISLRQANAIKRNIYKEIRNVGYKLDANLSTKREAMKALASGIKQEIEGKVGGTRIADINKKLSIYGRLEDRVVDLLARNNRNNLLSLTDAVLAGGGIAAGSPIGFAAVLARQGLGSTRGLTTSANLLNKAKKIGTGKTAKVLRQGVKRAVLNVN